MDTDNGPSQVTVNLGSSPISSPPERLTPPPPPQPIILEQGPFAHLPLPFASARANAAHIVRSHVSTYLITHPHLDHLSGFAINTASFHATSRPKRLAALPFTVDAIKKHIFNDVIWPNMSDEDGGVGFVTFQRLKEGGDVMVGEGRGRGYIEVCEGLGVKGFTISHGSCMRTNQPQRGSIANSSDGYGHGAHGYDKRTLSVSQALGVGSRDPSPHGYFSPGGGPQNMQSFVGDMPQSCAVDSTAYFVRDVATSKEVLIFGDVEPDSLSFSPRLSTIWLEAAPKIASGLLTGMFIECSYDDSQPDEALFGHLAPRHLVAELHSLGDLVREQKIARAQEKAQRKRKRSGQGSATPGPGSLSEAMEKKRNKSIFTRGGSMTPHRRSSLPLIVPEEPVASPFAGSSQLREVRSFTSEPMPMEAPLKGLRVVIIHVKDTLKDGPHISERILKQLNDHAAALEHNGWGGLGCDFIMSQSGRDYIF